jgi:hypothetical protein
MAMEKFNGVAEKVTVSGTFDSDVVIDTNTQGVILSTASATANFTVNLRGDGSNSLDASLDNNESITVAYISKQQCNVSLLQYNSTSRRCNSNSGMARWICTNCWKRILK